MAAHASEVSRLRIIVITGLALLLVALCAQRPKLHPSR